MSGSGPEFVLDSQGRPFSRVVKTGALLWVSGVTPPRPLLDQGAGAEEQTLACLERLAGTLAEVDAKPSQIARVTVYLTDAADFEPMNRAFRRFFGDTPPARTTVVAGLVVPGARVEIDAVAVADDA